MTIARGHLELLLEAADAELEVALDELARIDAIIGRLLLLATADQPDFLRIDEIELDPFLEDVFMRWSEVAPRAWRLGPLAPGRLNVDPDRFRTALDALVENASNTPPTRGDRAAGGHDGRAAADRGRGRGLRVPDAALHGSSTASLGPTPRARGCRWCRAGLAIVDAIAKAHGGRRR